MGNAANRAEPERREVLGLAPGQEADVPKRNLVGELLADIGVQALRNEPRDREPVEKIYVFSCRPGDDRPMMDCDSRLRPKISSPPKHFSQSTSKDESYINVRT